MEEVLALKQQVLLEGTATQLRAPTIPTGFPHPVPVTDQPLAAWEDILMFFYMFSYHAQSHLLEFILSVTVTMKPILFDNLLFSLVIFCWICANPGL